MIKLYLKGFMIGIGKILPGVSGSLIACVLNVYEESLTRIKRIFINPIDNFCYFLPLSLGILSSILLGSNILKIVFANFYKQSIIIITLILLFLVPRISKEVKKEKIPLAILVMILLSLMFMKKTSNLFIYKNNLYSDLTVIIIGCIESFSTIFPGISGTAIFINLGYYNFVLDLFSNIYKYILLKQFWLFIISVTISAYLLILLLNFLLNKYKENLYALIYGVSLFSIYQLISYLNKQISIIIIITYFIYLNKKIYKA